MDSTATTNRITTATWGQVLSLSPGPDMEPTEYLVGACPDGCTQPDRWLCATHPEQGAFPNQLQKDIHINSGSHALAWLCFEHGPVVP